MKLSVITITCRETPRLEDMAKTLSASCARAESVELEWIVVDEKQRTWNLTPASSRMTVEYAIPLPSDHRTAGEKMPAHNSARMAGLMRATGEYVVFLNDCTLVTQDWASVALDCFKEGKGWKCKTHVVNDLNVPANGIVRMKDHHDRLRPVPSNTVPGACWGAPAAAFAAIHGFDLAYDGEDKGHDLDAVLRLARIGLQFVTTERAFGVRLRRTKTKGEISTRKEAFNGAKNHKLLQKLHTDRNRVHPLVPAGNGVIAYVPTGSPGHELAQRPLEAVAAAPAPVVRRRSGTPPRPPRPRPVRTPRAPVNVMHHGAKGDRVTDDTAAVSAAVAAASDQSFVDEVAHGMGVDATAEAIVDAALTPDPIVDDGETAHSSEAERDDQELGGDDLGDLSDVLG